MPAQRSEEERQQHGDGAGPALAAYLMGAATVGILMLVRSIQKKLRRRKRVVRAKRNLYVACDAPAQDLPLFYDREIAVSVIAELAALLRRPTAAASGPPPANRLCPPGWRAAGALPVFPLPGQAAGAHPGHTHDPAHL